VGQIAWYLDTSILVALLTPEPLSERADTFIRNSPGALVVSDFAVAEFSAVIARRVRVREFTAEQAGLALGAFDEWLVGAAERGEIQAGDVALATAYIRRLDLPLLAPDALHISIARRLEATLVTFDRGMAAAAGALGVAVTIP
jgi:hypothetical protein